MRKLKVGIIGVAEIIAVNDVNVDRAREVARKFEIPEVLENYNDLFAVVNAVVICTPNKFHSEITVAALEAGVHVLCEKPMAITTEECEKMVRLPRSQAKSFQLLTIISIRKLDR